MDCIRSLNILNRFGKRPDLNSQKLPNGWRIIYMMPQLKALPILRPHKMARVLRQFASHIPRASSSNPEWHSGVPACCQNQSLILCYHSAPRFRHIKSFNKTKSVHSKRT